MMALSLPGTRPPLRYRLSVLADIPHAVAISLLLSPSMEQYSFSVAENVLSVM
jgi:hypothetical protein